MKTPSAICLATTLLLSACGGSGGSFNPFNWFGSSQPSETLPADTAEVQTIADARPLVQQVLSLHIDQTPGGAIIRATGLPPTQGYFDAELVALNEGFPVDGVLTYQFRIERPHGFERVINQASREIIVGQFVSNTGLNGVTTIQVIGAENGLISRR